jgi:hypothetical protein
MDLAERADGAWPVRGEIRRDVQHQKTSRPFSADQANEESRLTQNRAGGMRGASAGLAAISTTGRRSSSSGWRATTTRRIEPPWIEAVIVVPAHEPAGSVVVAFEYGQRVYFKLLHIGRVRAVTGRAMLRIVAIRQQVNLHDLAGLALTDDLGVASGHVSADADSITASNDPRPGEDRNSSHGLETRIAPKECRTIFDAPGPPVRCVEGIFRGVRLALVFRTEPSPTNTSGRERIFRFLQSPRRFLNVWKKKECRNGYVSRQRRCNAC